jgi:hypothetical protein
LQIGEKSPLKPLQHTLDEYLNARYLQLQTLGESIHDHDTAKRTWADDLKRTNDERAKTIFRMRAELLGL